MPQELNEYFAYDFKKHNVARSCTQILVRLKPIFQKGIQSYVNDFK